MLVMTKRLTVTISALLALGLASAGLASGDSDVARLLEAADPIATHEAGTSFTSPRVVSCMEALGYDDFVYRPSIRGDHSAVDPTDDLVGFGISNFALEDQQLALELWSLPAGDRERWQIERQPGFDFGWPSERYMQAIADAQECEAAAIDSFVAMRAESVDPDLLDRFHESIHTEQRSDPAIANGTKEWAACMAAQGHDYTDVHDLRSTLSDEFDLNHVYGAGIGLPDVERLQRQFEAIADFRDREIYLGHASDMCSVALWEAKTALRERVAADIINNA